MALIIQIKQLFMMARVNYNKIDFHIKQKQSELTLLFLKNSIFGITSHFCIILMFYEKLLFTRKSLIFAKF